MAADFMDMADMVGLAVMDMATLITTHLIMLIHEL